MLDYPVVLSISIVVVVLIAVVLFITVGIIPALTVFGVAGLVFYLLHLFGRFDVTIQDGKVAFDFHENAPSGKDSSVGTAPHIKEVFHVYGNTYTYDEAPAVCAANNAELASFDQLTEAFSLGAEWCSYGWSAGGMALYPTQASTWSKLQGESQEAKRTACGHPGVNGGYFDPKLKFGVNCYGIKPRNHGMKFPQPLPTQDPGFDSIVNKFKKMLPMNLSGFNRDIWSERDLAKEAEKGVSNMAASLENM
jgi:hypothetical protein